MGLHEENKRLNRRRRRALAAAVALIPVVLEIGGMDARELLAWERSGLRDWQVWRLVSGHFVHLGWSHLVLNIAGLGLVGWLVGGQLSWSQWCLAGVVSIAAIDAGFWFVDTELEWYVGLSGLLHGLLAAGLLTAIRDRNSEAIILAAVVLGKLTWEQLAGPLPGSTSTSGGQVIVNAHLYGAFGGVLGALLLWRSARPATSI